MENNTYSLQFARKDCSANFDYFNINKKDTFYIVHKNVSIYPNMCVKLFRPTEGMFQLDDMKCPSFIICIA